MDANEQEERERLVAEALSWLGTPYHHAGRIKGGGTDCGMLILQTFINVGLIPDTEVNTIRWTGICIGARSVISDG